MNDPKEHWFDWHKRELDTLPAEDIPPAKPNPAHRPGMRMFEVVSIVLAAVLIGCVIVIAVLLASHLRVS